MDMERYASITEYMTPMEMCTNGALREARVYIKRLALSPRKSSVDDVAELLRDGISPDFIVAATIGQRIFSMEHCGAPVTYIPGGRPAGMGPAFAGVLYKLMYLGVRCQKDGWFDYLSLPGASFNESAFRTLIACGANPYYRNDYVDQAIRRPDPSYREIGAFRSLIFRSSLEGDLIDKIAAGFSPKTVAHHFALCGYWDRLLDPHVYKLVDWHVVQDELERFAIIDSVLPGVIEQSSLVDFLSAAFHQYEYRGPSTKTPAYVSDLLNRRAEAVARGALESSQLVTADVRPRM